MGVVSSMCHQIAVMYAGRIVETGLTEDVFALPGHPYTYGLMESTPRLDIVTRRLRTIEGNPIDVVAPPGCSFHPRCPLQIDPCSYEVPPLVEARSGRGVACWRSFDDALRNAGTVSG
jgi:oligopeptide/dipeptide ABC transporter ATP-binding protein